MKRVIKWHRYLGLLLGAFLINLAVTGILLNHTDDLQLVDTPVQNDLLLGYYGIPEPTLENVFESGQHRISETSEAVYLDGYEVPLQKPVVGITARGDLIFVASSNQLDILTTEGEAVDSLTSPETLTRIGNLDGEVVLETSKPSAGTHATFKISDDLTSFISLPSTQLDDTRIRWSSAAQLNAREQERIMNALPRPGIPVERVVQDLHSGRIFGRAGQWLFDAVAILMITLVLSGFGLWMWRTLRLRQSRKRLK